MEYAIKTLTFAPPALLWSHKVPIAVQGAEQGFGPSSHSFFSRYLTPSIPVHFVPDPPDGDADLERNPDLATI